MPCVGTANVSFTVSVTRDEQVAAAVGNLISQLHQYYI
jgi:hypothetical protein